MNKLYYNTLCPISRFIKLLLDEHKIEYSIININFWQNPKDFFNINHAGEVPVLQTECGSCIISPYSILDFLKSRDTGIFLFSSTENRLEIERIIYWFNKKFYREVTEYIINEKVIKFYNNSGNISAEAIRVARNNLSSHISYLEFLLSNRNWLAGESMSFADFAACAHLSILDYFGDINWSKSSIVKDWYSLIKSRPSFQKLLTESITGFNPSSHYRNLDF
jgi:glutathione S-transferase